MNADEEVASRALQQAADACGLDIATNSAIWKTRHVARIVTRDGSAYAFKCFRSATIATKESSILRHLASAAPSCGVQLLHLCLNGDALASTELGPMMVTRWIDGATKSYDEIGSEGWAVLGRSLATLHLAVEGFRSDATESLSETLYTLSFDGERARIQNDRKALEAIGASPRALALQDSRLRLFETHLKPCVSAWPKSDAQLIHNDYNVHNYIFGDDDTLSVIDWDRSLFAPREYEVVRCLNHLPLETPALASAFLAGYAERGSLDGEVLAWAVHAALVSHATKHWPVELALEGAPAAMERLVGLDTIVSRLAQDTGELMAFFSERADKKN